MRRILYILFTLSMVGLVLFNEVNAKDKYDLVKMASILEQENVSIDKWTLHSREIWETVQAKQEVKDKVDQLRSQFPDWDWAISEDDRKWEAKAHFTPRKNVNESIQVLSTVTNHQVQTYIVYEATGKGWSEETKDFIDGSIMERINSIFHGNSTTFSCIYGNFGDKMNESVSGHVNQLLKAFQAKEVESLEEDSFISTTAYTPLFEESIQTMTDEMNLQLGVRKQGLGTKTTFVVGTPIITVEY